MLPLVRPYEYLIVQALLLRAGDCPLADVVTHAKHSVRDFDQAVFDHALRFMLATGYFSSDGVRLALNGIVLDVEFSDYLQDLLDYGLGKFDVDYSDVRPGERFRLWAKYRKEQVQMLLLHNPRDIMKGTAIYDGVAYMYVPVLKDDNIKSELRYMDGYIDERTFQWETVANVSDRELDALKSARLAHIFVRKVELEDGIVLPFTYIGSGTMEYVEGSKKPNGAHLFRIAMDSPAPEDVYFDFKLPV